MSLIKDFNDLHIGTKGVILNVISSVPFFFIIIYKFNTSLISKVQENPLIDIDFYFIISICLGLSILWFFMNFIVASLTLSIFNWIDTNSEEDTLDADPDELLKGVFFLTYIYSIGYLALATYINTWVGLSFKWTVLSCFGFIVFRIIWITLWYGVSKKLS